MTKNFGNLNQISFFPPSGCDKPVIPSQKIKLALKLELKLAVIYKRLFVLIQKNLALDKVLDHPNPFFKSIGSLSFLWINFESC